MGNDRKIQWSLTFILLIALAGGPLSLSQTGNNYSSFQPIQESPVIQPTPTKKAEPEAKLTVPERLQKRDKLYHPALQVILAYNDVIEQKEEDRPFIRYLDLSNYPEELRVEAAKVLAGDQAGGSSRPSIVPPGSVPGSNLTLLRLNLRETGVDPKVHDRLIVNDVVFHEVYQQAYQYPDFVVDKERCKVINGKHCWPDTTGQYWPIGTYYRQVFRDRQEILNYSDRVRTALEQLHKETHSELPIVRANVYFRNNASAEARVPGYYERLNVHSVDDWFRLVGVDWQKYQVLVRAAVAKSGVTQQPRGYVVLPGKYGYAWFSIDTRLAVKGQNFLKVTSNQIDLRNTAVEGIGLLPNGMQAYVAFTVDGNLNLKLQTKAPDDIASCFRSPRNDSRVLVGVRCLQCHDQDGYNPINDWFRNQYKYGSQIPGYQLKLSQQFRDEYLLPLEPFMQQSQQTYLLAVQRATGWSVKEYARNYAHLYDWDDNLFVTIKQAERETGVPKQALITAISRALAHGEQNTVLSDFLLPEQDQQGIPIRQWEEEYDILQDFLIRFYP